MSSAIFGLKTVSVECRTSIIYLSNQDYEGMISSGEFDYGENILFTDFLTIPNIDGITDF